MARAYESPSSINTYLQCPRKYYYIYIAKYSTLPSIHLIRGNVAHSALEHFYNIPDDDIEKLSITDYEIVLRTRIKKQLKDFWFNNMGKFKKLDLSNDQHLFYFRETQEMMQTWMGIFLEKLRIKIDELNCIKSAFKSLIPTREKKFFSPAFKVMGFIDVIEEIDGKIRLMDYKTSKRPHINEAYKLQLAIYSLLYYEQCGRLPDEVGIYFLKYNEQSFPADEQLMEFAKRECILMQKKTKTDKMDDYPKQRSPLCKYSTGQCDFYDFCMKTNT